jgi:hypothetical protein
LYEEQEMPPLKISPRGKQQWQNYLLETEALKKQKNIG